MSASTLTKDLGSLAKIVGQLGMSIAAAQKAFNLDYLESLASFLKAASTIAGDADAEGKLDTLAKILLEAGPPRYQFSETEIEFRADLAKSFDGSGALSVGGNIGAVSLTASFAVGYGYDYRAAARVRSVLHAVPADRTVLAQLLARADKLAADGVDLPKAAEVDSEITKLVTEIAKMLPKDAEATS